MRVVVLNGQHFAGRTAAGNLTLLDGITRVSSRELLQSICLAALLAHERAGTIELQLVARGRQRGVLAAPTGKVVNWPSPSAESRLVFHAGTPVRDAIHRWLVHDCSNPWTRGMEQVCVMLVRRGLARLRLVGGRRRYVAASAELTEAAAGGLQSVNALLEDCRLERPALWTELNAQIRRAAAARLALPSPPPNSKGQPKTAPRSFLNPWDDEPASELPVPELVGTDAAARSFGWKLASLFGAIGWLGFTITLMNTDTRFAVMQSLGVLLICCLGLEVYLSRVGPATATQLSGTSRPSVPPRASFQFEDDVAYHASWSGSVDLRRGAWRHTKRTVRCKVALLIVPGAAWVLAALWTHGTTQPMVVATLLAGGIASGMQYLKSRTSKAITRRVVLAGASSGASGPVSPPLQADSLEGVVAARIPSDSSGTHPAATLVPVKLETCTLDTLPVVSESSQARVRAIGERGPAVRSLAGRALVILALLSTAVTLAIWLVQRGDLSDTQVMAKPVLLLITLFAVFGPDHIEVEGRSAVLLFVLRLASLTLTRLRGGGPVERLRWQREVVPIRPVFLPFLGLVWVGVTLAYGLALQAHGGLGWPSRISSLLLVTGYMLWLSGRRADLERRYPIHSPLTLLALRVFGTPRLDDFVELTDHWRWLGSIQQLDGPDTAGNKAEDVVRYLRGRLDQSIVADDTALEARLGSIRATLDPQLRFPLNSMQCTDATWQTALDRMLRTADAVVMDLAGFSNRNLGCVYELGQIIERIPVHRVILIVDDDADMPCLREVLDQAWRGLSPASPNSSTSPYIRAVRLRAEVPAPTARSATTRPPQLLLADKTRFAGVLLDMAGGGPIAPAFPDCHWARSGLPGPLSRF
ncbi:MAG TPA: hypothetical protein VKV73_30515 [Chloroflexota bacterium]|nr:hypothetical protein [Chloroflexota bacterium]